MKSASETVQFSSEIEDLDNYEGNVEFPPENQLEHFSLTGGHTQTSSLETHLDQLAALIANITESYTVAIFLADAAEKSLHVSAAHTLSRSFISTAKIGYGCGLVGWTAENAVRISVCPFEHDATTLLYYKEDQGLKSFIAVPILSNTKELLGVIACDSKKSYAYAKLMEKHLVACASQAANLIHLHRQLGSSSQSEIKFDRNELEQLLEDLRNQDSESALLSKAAALPSSILDRDALVVITTADAGVGKGTYYAEGTPGETEHHLLDIVCKHKKIICGDRSVHALPIQGSQDRSFVSVPFRVLEREVGSLNALSRPKQPFTPEAIAALETIAAVVGRELERIRLRDRLATVIEAPGISSWKPFAARAEVVFEHARTERSALSLIRVCVSNFDEIEDLVGIDAGTAVMQRLMRLTDQVKRKSAIASYLFGFQILILTEQSETEHFIGRLSRLVERLSLEEVLGKSHPMNASFGNLLKTGLKISTAEFPKDGDNLQELCAASLQRLQVALRRQELEIRTHA